MNNKIDQAKTILKKYFGYDTFRESQQDVIERLLNENKHCLLLMPTGGGKSICYQLPSQVFEGGTIVISPLIALMQDQVDALRKKGIDANLSIQPYLKKTVNPDLTISYQAGSNYSMLHLKDSGNLSLLKK